MKYIMDYWEINQQVKREYTEKLERAWADRKITQEEYEDAKAKMKVRVLIETNRRYFDGN